MIMILIKINFQQYFSILSIKVVHMHLPLLLQTTMKGTQMHLHVYKPYYIGYEDIAAAVVN